MRIIDLLIKIEEGKEVPKFITFDNKVFEYDEEDKEYAYTDNYEGTTQSLLTYIFEQELNSCEGYDTDYEILTHKVGIVKE